MTSVNSETLRDFVRDIGGADSRISNREMKAAIEDASGADDRLSRREARNFLQDMGVRDAGDVARELFDGRSSLSVNSFKNRAFGDLFEDGSVSFVGLKRALKDLDDGGSKIRSASS